ncbi:MAG: DUF2889 domain-containing protein [Desulfobacterales bacterium]|nr:DUF2889 domain-containing protein [Desulfobacterales bacterium]
MAINEPSAEQRVHNRHIDVSTYAPEDNAIVVEGRLTDNRYRSTYYLSGDRRPPGIVHEMVIRMRVVGLDLTIEDIDVAMDTVPRDQCRQTLNSLRPVIGMQIKAGFTEAVKTKVGGPKGCTHLVALLLAMAPAAVQGAWAAMAQSPLVPGQYSDKALEILEDTCWLWRSEGPLMQELREKLSRFDEE